MEGSTEWVAQQASKIAASGDIPGLMAFLAKYATPPQPVVQPSVSRLPDARKPARKPVKSKAFITDSDADDDDGAMTAAMETDAVRAPARDTPSVKKPKKRVGNGADEGAGPAAMETDAVRAPARKSATTVVVLASDDDEDDGDNPDTAPVRAAPARKRANEGLSLWFKKVSEAFANKHLDLVIEKELANPENQIADIQSDQEITVDGKREKLKLHIDLTFVRQQARSIVRAMDARDTQVSSRFLSANPAREVRICADISAARSRGLEIVHRDTENWMLWIPNDGRIAPRMVQKSDGPLGEGVEVPLNKCIQMPAGDRKISTGQFALFVRHNGVCWKIVGNKKSPKKKDVNVDWSCTRWINYARSPDRIPYSPAAYSVQQVEMLVAVLATSLHAGVNASVGGDMVIMTSQELDSSTGTVAYQTPTIRQVEAYNGFCYRITAVNGVVSPDWCVNLPYARFDQRTCAVMVHDRYDGLATSLISTGTDLHSGRFITKKRHYKFSNTVHLRILPADVNPKDVVFLRYNDKIAGPFQCDSSSLEKENRQVMFHYFAADGRKVSIEYDVWAHWSVVRAMDMVCIEHDDRDTGERGNVMLSMYIRRAEYAGVPAVRTNGYMLTDPKIVELNMRTAVARVYSVGLEPDDWSLPTVNPDKQWVVLFDGYGILPSRVRRYDALERVGTGVAIWTMKTTVGGETRNDAALVDVIEDWWGGTSRLSLTKDERAIVVSRLRRHEVTGAPCKRVWLHVPNLELRYAFMTAMIQRHYLRVGGVLYLASDVQPIEDEHVHVHVYPGFQNGDNDTDVLAAMAMDRREDKPDRVYVFVSGAPMPASLHTEFEWYTCSWNVDMTSEMPSRLYWVKKRHETIASATTYNTIGEVCTWISEQGPHLKCGLYSLDAIAWIKDDILRKQRADVKGEKMQKDKDAVIEKIVELFDAAMTGSLAEPTCYDALLDYVYQYRNDGTRLVPRTSVQAVRQSVKRKEQPAQPAQPVQPPAKRPATAPAAAPALKIPLTTTTTDQVGAWAKILNDIIAVTATVGKKLKNTSADKGTDLRMAAELVDASTKAFMEAVLSTRRIVRVATHALRAITGSDPASTSTRDTICLGAANLEANVRDALHAVRTASRPLAYSIVCQCRATAKVVRDNLRGVFLAQAAATDSVNLTEFTEETQTIMRADGYADIADYAAMYTAARKLEVTNTPAHASFAQEKFICGFIAVFGIDVVGRIQTLLRKCATVPGADSLVVTSSAKQEFRSIVLGCNPAAYAILLVKIVGWNLQLGVSFKSVDDVLRMHGVVKSFIRDVDAIYESLSDNVEDEISTFYCVDAIKRCSDIMVWLSDLYVAVGCNMEGCAPFYDGEKIVLPEQYDRMGGIVSGDWASLKPQLLETEKNHLFAKLDVRFRAKVRTPGAGAPLAVSKKVPKKRVSRQSEAAEAAVVVNEDEDEDKDDEGEAGAPRPPARAQQSRPPQPRPASSQAALPGGYDAFTLALEACERGARWEKAWGMNRPIPPPPPGVSQADIARTVALIRSHVPYTGPENADRRREIITAYPTFERNLSDIANRAYLEMEEEEMDESV
jgi:hypothetical protein